MQIFKWMPLKAEELNIQPETPSIYETQEKDEIVRQNNKMSANINSASNEPANTKSLSTSNGCPTNNHDSDDATDENKPAQHDTQTSTAPMHESSSSQRNATYNSQLASLSPPPKRHKSSASSAMDQETVNNLKEESMVSSNDEELEPPQYNELRRVDQDDSQSGGDSLTPANAQAKPANISDLPAASVIVKAETQTSCEHAQAQKLDTTTSQSMNDVTMMDEDISIREADESQEMEMEDLSSIAKSVTETIVTEVSNAQDN